MGRMLKLEFSRAFTSKGFWLALFIGIIISVIHIFTMVLPLSLNLEEYLSHDIPMVYPGDLFSSWIGGNSATFYTFLFFLILPILAVLPHADSFFTDRKGGFIQNICIRVNKYKYYTAKYISTFITGGITVVVPLLLNFYLCLMLLPSMNPEATAGNNPIDEASTFPHLYFTHPFLYVLLFLLIIFIFSGLIATFALGASYHLGYRFLVLIAPFAFYLFFMALFSLVDLEQWQPTNFLVPAYPHDTLLPIIIVTSSLFLVTIGIFFGTSIKKDILT